jgi:hypothetical protein
MRAAEPDDKQEDSGCFPLAVRRPNPLATLRPLARTVKMMAAIANDFLDESQGIGLQSANGNDSVTSKRVSPEKPALGSEYHGFSGDGIIELYFPGKELKWLVEIIFPFRQEFRVIRVIDDTESEAAHVQPQLMGLSGYRP